MVLKTKSYEVEEKWNAYSHAVGIVLSIIGMIIFSQNNINEAPTLCVGIWVYSISLILLLTASTIYHKTINPKTKKGFEF